MRRRVLGATPWLLALGLALIAPLLTSGEYALVLLDQALIAAVVVLGLNFIYGFGGIVSLAQAAFWGVGAYTSAVLSVDHQVPVALSAAAAMMVTAACGLAIGVPTLRLRSHYLVMATLGFGIAVQLVLQNASPVTHGAEGIRNIPPAALGPWVVDDTRAFAYLALAIVMALVLATWRFRHSRLGRALEATRDDELAAGATGVDVAYVRSLAFALSAACAGLGGSLWAHFSAYIAPESFDLMASVRFLAMLLVGGSGTLAGPILGAFALTYLPEWLRFLKDWYMAIYGLAIAVCMVVAPDGLVGLVRLNWGRPRARRWRGRLGHLVRRRRTMAGTGRVVA